MTRKIEQPSAARVAAAAAEARLHLPDVPDADLSAAVEAALVGAVAYSTGTRAEIVLDAAERLFEPDLLHPLSRTLLAGLADKPRPGEKRAARDAAVAILREVNKLRVAVERTRPTPVLGS